MTGRRKLFCLVFALALSSLTLLHAQGVQVTLEASTVETVPGQPFTLSVQVEGAGQVEESPRIENDAFRVLGSSKQTSLQIVNGRMSSSMTWQFTLLADRLGDHVIGPIEVRADGAVHRSNALTLKVSRRGAPPTSRGRVGRSGYGPPQGGVPGSSPRGGGSTVAATGPAHETEIRFEVSDEELWVGQSFLASTRIQSPYQISQRHRCEAVAPPRFDGFVPEELPLPRGPAYRIEQREGRKLLVGELTRHLLLATKPGTFTLQPSPMRIPFQSGRRRRSLFDMDFDSFFDSPFGRTVTEMVGAEACEVTVRPLPSTGRPDDFSSVVGRRIRMHGSLDKKQVKTSEAVTLRLQIEGEADLRSIKAPKLDFGENFKVFEPKSQQKLELRNGRIWGQKSFEIVLVPRKEGSIELPVPRLAYFDVDTGSYAVAAGARLSVKVLPGEKEERIDLSTLQGGKAIRSLGQDIRFIREDEEALLADASLVRHREPLFWGMLVLPWFLLFVGRIFGVWQARRSADVAGLRASRALRAARKAVRAAGPVDGKEARKFYGELRAALASFLADKFDQAAAGVVLEQAGEALEGRGLDSPVLLHFQSLSRRLEARAFAGGDGDEEAMEADRRDLLALMAELEAKL